MRIARIMTAENDEYIDRILGGFLRAMCYTVIECITGVSEEKSNEGEYNFIKEILPERKFIFVACGLRKAYEFIYEWMNEHKTLADSSQAFKELEKERMLKLYADNKEAGQYGCFYGKLPSFIIRTKQGRYKMQMKYNGNYYSSKVVDTVDEAVILRNNMCKSILPPDEYNSKILGIKRNPGMRGIYHQGNRYVVIITRHAKKHYIGCFMTEDEAKTALAKYEAENE